jgi:hypothetical protein
MLKLIALIAIFAVIDVILYNIGKTWTDLF